MMYIDGFESCIHGMKLYKVEFFMKEKSVQRQGKDAIHICKYKPVSANGILLLSPHSLPTPLLYIYIYIFGNLVFENY